MGATMAVSLVALLATAPRADVSDGRAVFITHCTACHSVESEGIKASPSAALVAARLWIEAIDWKRLCKKCTPDLSDVGERRRDPQWLKDYLKNKKKGRNGLRHDQVPVTLKGEAWIIGDGPWGFTLTTEEEQALVTWLSERRTPTQEFTVTREAPPSAPPQSTEADSTPVLLNAKTVVVIGVTGQKMLDRLWANPSGPRAREKVEDVLKRWGRYEIVEGPERADLVLVVLEAQRNLSLFKRANLVAELKVYRGGQEPGEQTPTLWSGDAAEGFRTLPATKVAEKFRDYVIKLLQLRSQTEPFMAIAHR